MTQEFVRQESGIVNSDLSAYHAAKKRRQREQHINRLEQRINKLEKVVCDLEQAMQTCKREEMT